MHVSHVFCDNTLFCKFTCQRFTILSEFRVHIPERIRLENRAGFCWELINEAHTCELQTSACLYKTPTIVLWMWNKIPGVNSEMPLKIFTINVLYTADTDKTQRWLVFPVKVGYIYLILRCLSALSCLGTWIRIFPWNLIQYILAVNETFNSLLSPKNKVSLQGARC